MRPFDPSVDPRNADVIDGGDAAFDLVSYALAEGKDRVVGRGGRDELVGGAGRDDLLGGKGRDLCVGGQSVTSCRAFAKPRSHPLHSAFAEWERHRFRRRLRLLARLRR